MRRVVVTGLGIVSSIGNDQTEVLKSLQEGKSGIKFMEEYQELGLRSHIAGKATDATAQTALLLSFPVRPGNDRSDNLAGAKSRETGSSQTRPGAIAVGRSGAFNLQTQPVG